MSATHRSHPERLRERRESAARRQLAHNGLTLEEKLQKALRMGHPDTREVRRLKALILANTKNGDLPDGE